MLYPPQSVFELGQRPNQEDSISPRVGLADSSTRLFLVCDGMGGHSQGEVASAAVCDGIASALDGIDFSEESLTSSMLQQAMDHAFDTLDAADTQKQGQMGTTLTMLCLHRSGCTAAHIGDSRIYHLRPSSGEVLYRSRDDSLVQQLYDIGQITYEEMSTHPQRNIITKAMQPLQEHRVEPTVVNITDIRDGDYFYLCSDGMLEQMDDDELLAVLQAESSDEEKAKKLAELTDGNIDNHSAYLVHVREVIREDSDIASSSADETPASLGKRNTIIAAVAVVMAVAAIIALLLL